MCGVCGEWGLVCLVLDDWGVWRVGTGLCEVWRLSCVEAVLQPLTALLMAPFSGTISVPPSLPLLSLQPENWRGKEIRRSGDEAVQKSASFHKPPRPNRHVIFYLIYFISPLFNQVGQLWKYLIYNCDLAKIKQSSATKTTTQSYTRDTFFYR